MGTKKGQVRKTARRAYEPNRESLKRDFDMIGKRKSGSGGRKGNPFPNIARQLTKALNESLYRQTGGRGGR